MFETIAVRGGQTFTQYDRYAEIQVVSANEKSSGGIERAVVRIDTAVLNRKGDDYLFSTLYLDREETLTLIGLLQAAL